MTANWKGYLLEVQANQEDPKTNRFALVITKLEFV